VNAPTDTTLYVNTVALLADGINTTDDEVKTVTFNTKSVTYNTGTDTVKLPPSIDTTPDDGDHKGAAACIDGYTVNCVDVAPGDTNKSMPLVCSNHAVTFHTHTEMGAAHNSGTVTFADVVDTFTTETFGHTGETPSTLNSVANTRINVYGCEADSFWRHTATPPVPSYSEHDDADNIGLPGLTRTTVYTDVTTVDGTNNNGTHNAVTDTTSDKAGTLTRPQHGI